MPTLSGPARVIDGDTLDVGHVRVRLHAVDAPESDQVCRGGPAELRRCGLAATRELRRLAANAVVRCEVRGKDVYGRSLGVCTARGVDLGEALVAHGYARAFARYGDDHVAAERAARSARSGFWQTDWQAPWDHRVRRRTAAAGGAPRT